MTGLLRPHQYQAAAALYPALQQYGGAYLAHGVGSGKSLSAITLAKLLKAQNILVIVGPMSALGVWRMELRRWWPGATARVFHGFPEGYPAIWSLNNLVRPWVTVRNVDGITPTEEALWKKYPPDLLISDEHHYQKTPSAKRTRMVGRIRAHAKWFLAMSGTPTHSVLDYWAQYRLIDPEHPLWSQPFGAYSREVGIYGGPKGNWFQGAKPGAAEYIADVIAPTTHWFRTQDLGLPEPIYTEVPIELSPVEQKAYTEFEKTLRTEVVAGRFTAATHTFTRAMRLHQISGGHATEEQEIGVERVGKPEQLWFPKTSKMDALEEILKDRAHQKVIVVMRFHSEMHEIQRRLAKSSKVPWPQVLSGEDTNPIHREQTIKVFQESKDPQIILMQPRAGGISSTLTACDCMIFYSMEPSKIVWEQTIGRFWRIGQTTHVQVLMLTASPFDHALYEGLRQGVLDNDLAKFVLKEIACPVPA